MKINKRNPLHWLYLALFGINVIAAIVLRRFARPKTEAVVALYGHKLNGNLLAIHDHLRQNETGTIKPFFLTMDPAYHKRLHQAGIDSVLAISPSCIKWLIRADAIISDHGLHVLRFMLGRTGIKFFDVWHGIPFKGFDADDFRVQHRFDEIWVASPLMERLYVERYGFDESKVVVTGYARTDCLVSPKENRGTILEDLGFASPDSTVARHSSSQKYVLYAPTWQHDSHDRAIYPFGLDGATFLSTLAKTCASANATLLLRPHLNSTAASKPAVDNVVYLPLDQFPNTEQILLVSDMLICDWSSIAFDYLLLNRPTIFLDVKAPFAKGFSLGPDYRFGELVSNMEELVGALQYYLQQPDNYRAAHDNSADAMRQSIYANRADGRAAVRCFERLRQWLLSEGVTDQSASDKN